MSDQTTSEPHLHDATPEQMHAALFAHLIVQQSNMALMLLGKTPHPETGQTVQDLETAKLFIDMLEMLEAKTKGNLSKEESGMLKQALMNLQLAYVQAVETPPAESKEPPKQAASSPEEKPEPAKPPQTPAEDDEHKKKFSKKY